MASDPHTDTLADRLERPQRTYICRMPDGENSIIVRSKADELDECYTLMRAAAARLRHLDRILDAIERLFDGGPDTSCRTTWRRTYNTAAGHALVSSPPVECVEVPLDDLRAALDLAAAVRDTDA